MHARFVFGLFFIFCGLLHWPAHAQKEPLIPSYLALARPSVAKRLGLNEEQLASARKAVDQFQQQSWRPYILLPTGGQDTAGIQIRGQLEREAQAISAAAAKTLARILTLEQRQELLRLEKAGLPEEFIPVEKLPDIKLQTIIRTTEAPKGSGNEYRLSEWGRLTDRGTGGVIPTRSLKLAVEIDEKGRHMDLITDDKQQKFSAGHPEWLNITAVAYSPDGKSLAVGCGSLADKASGEVRVWDAAAGTLKLQKTYDSPVRYLAFESDQLLWVEFRSMSLR